MELDPWELVVKSCGICGEAQPAAQAQNAVRMDAKDVVALRVKLCSLDELTIEVGCHAIPDRPSAHAKSLSYHSFLVLLFSFQFCQSSITVVDRMHFWKLEQS